MSKFSANNYMDGSPVKDFLDVASPLTESLKLISFVDTVDSVVYFCYSFYPIKFTARIATL